MLRRVGPRSRRSPGAGAARPRASTTRSAASGARCCECVRRTLRGGSDADERPTPDPPEGLRDLIDAYCGDTIDDEQLRRLEAHLLADAAARREFVAYFQLHTELHFAVRARRAADAVLGLIDDRRRGPDAGRRRWTAAAAAASCWSRPRPSCRGAGPACAARGRRGRRRRRRRWPARRPAPAGRGRAAGWPWCSSSTARAGSRGGAARPAEGDGSWRRAAPPALGPRHAVVLSGVMLIVEGPADLELVAGDRVFCRRGRLRARVPEGAEGFVVASPGFGRRSTWGPSSASTSRTAARSRVMVFEGQAEAALLDGAGSAQRTQLRGRGARRSSSTRTPAGIAGRRAARGIRRPPRLASPPLVLDPSYPDAVLRVAAAGLLAVRGAADGAVPNEVPDGPPLRVNGPVALAGDPGPGGNGYAVFRPDAPEQYLDTDGLWELARDAGARRRALVPGGGLSTTRPWSACSRRRRPDPARRLLEWPHTFLRGDHRAEPAVPVPAGLGPVPAPLAARPRGGDNICSEAFYVPRCWHHVVAQKAAAGWSSTSTGTRPLPAARPRPSDRLLPPGGGTADDDPTEPTHIRPFVGRLDELALYDHPLSAEEIRAISAGHPDGPPAV